MESPFLSAYELAASVTRDDRPVVCDVRWYLDSRSGREAFLDGHVPQAIFVDLERVCCERTKDSSRGRHPFASPTRFVETLAALGINRDSWVVVYDDQFGSVAARLWFMLDCVGVRASILDGGIQAWRGVLEAGDSTPLPVPRWDAPFAKWPRDKVFDTDAVLAVIRDGSHTIFDARARDRYRGEQEPIDRIAGHIPGARSLPWTELVSPHAMLGSREVASCFEGADESVVVSCGSGVTACFLAVARRHAGLADAAIYEGSYSGWSADPERPIEVGDAGASELTSSELE